MSDRTACNSTDHLFVPVLEVTIPLLRCIHCNAFAYQETVRQLARNRGYRGDEEPPIVMMPVPYWRRFWLTVRRNLGFT